MDSNDDLILKRKVFISTVGWLGIITSSLLIYFLSLQVIRILILTESTIFKGFFGDDNSAFSQDFSDIYSMMLAGFGLIIVFSIFFLVSSIGVLKFKNWGRLSFISISWLLIITSVSAILIYLFYQGNILTGMAGQDISDDGFGSEMIGVFKVMFAMQIASYGILLVVINRMLFRVIGRFRSNDYRILFLR